MSSSDKYITIIASGGRTGTTFFGELLSKVVEDSFSVHEPDVLAGFNAKAWRAIQDFGLYHMIIGRGLGLTGLRNLTQRYLSGTMTDEALATAIRRHREKYYRGFEQTVIIESNGSWYGILPGIPHVFSNYRVAGIVRDPRTWVRSWVNYGGLYDKEDLVLRFGAQRLNPMMIADACYAESWPRMSAFQKICWQWLVVTRTLVKYRKRDDNVRVFRFEDLFDSADRAKHMDDMLQFITTYPDRILRYKFDPSLMHTVKNPSQRKGMPQWADWSPALCRQLHDICGACMRDFGYGTEEEWRQKIES